MDNAIDEIDKEHREEFFLEVGNAIHRLSKISKENNPDEKYQMLSLSMNIPKDKQADFIEEIKKSEEAIDRYEKKLFKSNKVVRVYPPVKKHKLSLPLRKKKVE